MIKEGWKKIKEAIHNGDNLNDKTMTINPHTVDKKSLKNSNQVVCVKNF